MSGSKGTGGGASGRGFRRTGSRPGAARRGAFIVYTDMPETFGDTLIRMRWKLAIVAAAVIVGAVVIYSLQVGTSAKPNIVSKPERDAVKAEVFRAPQFVYDFLDASSVASKLSFIRDPDTYSDSVREFYASRDAVADRYRGVLPAESSQFDDTIQVERFYAELDDRVRVIAVVAMEDGQKIDWPAFVQFNPVPTESLLSDGGTGGTFRVKIRDFEYYAGGYSDDREFQSYRIESEDLSDPVTIYAQRDSEVERALSRYTGPVAQRCVLSLSPGKSEDLSSRRLTVNALETKGWVLP